MPGPGDSHEPLVAALCRGKDPAALADWDQGVLVAMQYQKWQGDRSNGRFAVPFALQGGDCGLSRRLRVGVARHIRD